MSICSVIFFTNCKAASSVECPGLKPYCSGQSNVIEQLIKYNSFENLGFRNLEGRLDGSLRTIQGSHF